MRGVLFVRGPCAYTAAHGRLDRSQREAAGRAMAETLVARGETEMKRFGNRNIRVSRRRFLGRWAAAAAAFPYVVRPSVLGLAGAVPPSDRITVGLIGAGGRMGAIAGGLGSCKDAQRVAVCDVWAPARERLRRT